MTERVPRVNSLITEELNRIVRSEIDFPEGILMTITRVETSPNLFQTRVFVSVIPESREEEIFSLLQKKVYQIQQQFNKRVKMRPVPRIAFERETLTKEASEVEVLLDKIKTAR